MINITMTKERRFWLERLFLFIYSLFITIMNGYSRQGTLTKIFKFYIAEKTKTINVAMTKEKRFWLEQLFLFIYSLFITIMNGHLCQGTLTKIFKFYIAEKTKMINVAMTKEKRFWLEQLFLFIYLLFITIMNGHLRQGTLTKIFKFYIAEKTKMINVTMTKEWFCKMKTFLKSSVGYLDRTLKCKHC
jgi:hypothetical protein